MAKQPNEHFIDSNVRVLLGNWPTLCDLIAKHSLSVKDLLQLDDLETSSALKPLSEHQITDALRGPYQAFLKQQMTAYSKISRIQMTLTMTKEDAFKTIMAQENQEVNPAKLENLDPADLNALQTKLDELTVVHNQQWEDRFSTWQQQTLEALTQQGLEFSALEVNEFKASEPVSELRKRFIDLKVELPKLKQKAMNFAAYLKLKSTLTIHSILSRQQLPHEAVEINKFIKALKNVFNRIEQEEVALLQSQQAEIDDALSTIASI